MSLAGRLLRRLTGRGPALPPRAYGGIDPDRELPFLREQLRANASLVPVRVSGPNLLDNFTGETSEMRRAYRRALAEPSVKAALLGKIAAVMALGLNVKPHQDGPPRESPGWSTSAAAPPPRGPSPLDQEVADFVHHALTRCRGGLPELIWSVLSGGLCDGFSVSEKVWREEARGRFKGKVSLLKLKAKDTRYIQFELDAYRNVVGVIGMRGNSGEKFPPSDFVLFRYMSLFENPFGMSDLRAAYRAAEMIPAVLRLRMIFLDKYTGPFLWAKVGDPALVEQMKDRLAKARAGGFIVTSPDDDLEVIDLATRGTSEFLAALKDLREEVAIGISGAFLHIMTGEGQSGQRGNSQVQQDTVDLFIWLLAVTVADLVNEQIVPDLVDKNYGSQVGLPVVSLEAPNPEHVLAELDIDRALWEMGVGLDLDDVYARAGRRPPADLARALKKAPDAPDPFAEPGPGGGPGGGPFPAGPPRRPPGHVQ